MWRNSLYNTVGGLIRLSLSLISIPLLTRGLGLETYGLYISINAIINIALFAEWSVSSTITILVSKDTDVKSTDNESYEKTNYISSALLYVITLSLLTTALLFFSAPCIVRLFKNLNTQEILLFENTIKIGSGIVCARFLIQFYIGLLQLYKIYGIVNTLSTMYMTTNILVVLYIAYTSKDIVLIQKMQFSVSVVWLIIYHLTCYYSGCLSLRFFGKPTIRQFIYFGKYGMGMWVSSIGTIFFSQFDRLVVLRLLGVEWAGVYSAITSVGNQINVISSMPVQPLLPILKEYNKLVMSDEVIESVIVKMFAINSVIVLILGSGIIIFSFQLISILFEPNLLNIDLIRQALIIVTISYSVYSLNAVGYFSLLAIRDEKYLICLVLLSGTLSLCIIYIFSVNFGILGACIGNFGYSLTILLNNRIIKKINKEKYILSKIIILPVGFTVFILLVSALFNNFYINIFLYTALISFILFYMKNNFPVKIIY